MKKPIKSILFLLVLAGLTIGLAFFILKQMDKIGDTGGKPIVMPVPKKSVSKPVTIKKIDSKKIPRNNTPTQVVQDNAASETLITEPETDTFTKKINTPLPIPETKPIETSGAPAIGSGGKTIPSTKMTESSANLPAPAVQKTPSVNNIKPKKTANYSSRHNTILSLNSINFKEYGGTFEMKIQANQPVKKYKFFVLSKPSRIVIDLLGQWEKPPFWEKNVATSRIIKLRLWRYKDKLRIVGDLKSNKTVKADFDSVADGIVMTIK